MYKKEMAEILESIAISENIVSKIEIIKHLQNNPMYRCYFCDGFNYNCESYKME